ncbi:unnamed protein product [Mucor hiemalis]
MPPAPKKRTNRLCPEFYWASKNKDQCDHLKFFEHFSFWEKRTLINKYNDILNSTILEDNIKNNLRIEFKRWQKSEESNMYWEQKKASQITSAELLSNNDTGSPTNKISSNPSGSSYSSSISMDISDVKKALKSNLLEITRDDNYVIDEVNVLEKFREFQKSLGSSILTYKKHLHHLLATSGVLLVSKHSHSDLQRYLGARTSLTILKSIKEAASVRSFPRHKLIDLFNVIQDIVNQRVSSTEAIQRLLATIENNDGNNSFYSNNVIFCFNSMIEQLPTESIQLKEIELSTRLIQPFLQPLFENKEEDTYLRWTNTQTEEYKKEESINCSSKRPDGTITLRSYDDINLGFIEVKEEKHKSDMAKMNKDLYKLGQFSKNAIDENHLRGALGILVAGESIRFYLTQQLFKGFYQMAEIEHLNVPRSLAELPQLIGFVDNLCNLQHVFKSSCCQK